MVRGRKPKAEALARLHGIPGKRKLRREPVPRAGALVPSEQIDHVQYARGIWDHFLATAPLGMLKPIDVELLEALCVALALRRQAVAQVIALGLMVKSPEKGVPMQNPYLPVVNRQTEIARKLASELGLPVTARSRIDAPDAPLHADDDEEGPRDDLERYLAQRPN
jgi:P27 family predicted phage terminase small subunit